ncbi:MAG: hypothetical protein ACRCZY_02980 [Phocaeicola sp.]
MMTDLEQQYLNLAVIELKKYNEISEILGTSMNEVSKYWEQLKTQREQLSAIRKIWKSKYDNPKTTETFWEFKEWFDTVEKKSFYCGITENQIDELFVKDNKLTKRNRGRKLEIERLSQMNHTQKRTILYYHAIGVIMQKLIPSQQKNLRK